MRESVSEHVYWRTAAFAIERKIVAAIDLGTCNTKMAFAFNPLTHGGDVQVVVMDAWENAPGAVMAPTTLLIDHTGQVAAFGYEAEEKFRVLDVAKAKISYLFKNFKMALHQKEVSKFRLALFQTIHSLAYFMRLFPQPYFNTGT